MKCYDQGHEIHHFIVCVLHLYEMFCNYDSINLHQTCLFLSLVGWHDNKDIIVIRFCWNSYISYEFQVKFVWNVRISGWMYEVQPWPLIGQLAPTEALIGQGWASRWSAAKGPTGRTVWGQGSGSIGCTQSQPGPDYRLKSQSSSQP